MKVKVLEFPDENRISGGEKVCPINGISVLDIYIRCMYNFDFLSSVFDDPKKCRKYNAVVASSSDSVGLNVWCESYQEAIDAVNRYVKDLAFEFLTEN